MEKEHLKAMLKEMFKNKEITIEVDEKTSWGSKYFVTTVNIDGEKVYEEETYVGSVVSD
jgi:hypothetical protein